jgi:hypothetical protein
MNEARRPAPERQTEIPEVSGLGSAPHALTHAHPSAYSHRPPGAPWRDPPRPVPPRRVKLHHRSCSRPDEARLTYCQSLTHRAGSTCQPLNVTGSTSLDRLPSPAPPLTNPSTHPQGLPTPPHPHPPRLPPDPSSSPSRLRPAARLRVLPIRKRLGKARYNPELRAEEGLRLRFPAGGQPPHGSVARASYISAHRPPERY